MSTTFGVRSESGEIIEVAHRSSYIQWTNPVAHLLDDKIRAIPIDNSAQGIETIGDIKKSINNENNKQR